MQGKIPAPWYNNFRTGAHKTKTKKLLFLWTVQLTKWADKVPHLHLLKCSSDAAEKGKNENVFETKLVCEKESSKHFFKRRVTRSTTVAKIFELTVLVEAKLRRGSAILSSHPTIVPPVSKDRRNCGPSPQAASPDLRFLLSASENNSVYGVTIGGIVLTTRQCAADQWSVLKTCV